MDDFTWNSNVSRKVVVIGKKYPQWIIEQEKEYETVQNNFYKRLDRFNIPLIIYYETEKGVDITMQKMYLSIMEYYKHHGKSTKNS